MPPDERIHKNSIPTQQFFVKDHTKKKDDEDYPSCLVILTINFTEIFSKLGYMRIKKVLDNTDLNYANSTTSEVSGLKSI